MITTLLVIIYLAFISLGLPDSLLGSAWPILHQSLGVDRSLAGVVTIITSVGTILSSLLSTRFIARYGTGKVTFVSVLLTAVALLGIASAPSFLWLCLLSIPLGLGGGNVDAALNNFVANHYEAKHMSWLHSFWGIGATTGPIIMSFFLARDGFWRGGYLTVSTIQFALVAVLFLSLPLWKRVEAKSSHDPDQIQALSNREAFHLPKVPYAMLAFFTYVAMEGGTGLWGSSYLVGVKNLTPQQAASGVSLFYAGLTFGRILDGFVSMKWNNVTRMRFGQGLASLGILVLALPLSEWVSILGLAMIGLGSAPMFPSMIHETPRRFGKSVSQAVIGLQMAASYFGYATMPMLFGFLSKITSIALLPLYLGLMMVGLIIANERINTFVMNKKPIGEPHEL